MSQFRKDLEIVLLSLTAFFTGAYKAIEAEEDLPAESVEIYQGLKSESGVTHPQDFEKWVKLNRGRAAELAVDLHDLSDFRYVLPNDLNESLEKILRRREPDESLVEQPQVEKTGSF